MGKLNKFEDVDVLASLEAILKQNTGFYQSDFDIDKQMGNCFSVAVKMNL